ncbi:MAG: TIR domain-containing protein, partial [Ktedonobacteraceae bacterium]|nr:TIR domain-containing protein [Ktedonobacteraceae bacterium]
MIPSQNTINVFLSSVPEDEDFLRHLEKHLSTLQRNGLITLWSQRLVVPGVDWAKEVDQLIEQASIILLLVSPDFLASEYCHEVEVKRALELQETGQAHVIPVLLRPADWKDTPFGHLSPLPDDGKAIATWPNQDEAFLQVIEGIKKVLRNRQLDHVKQSGDRTPQPSPISPKPQPFPLVWNVPYRYPAILTGRDQLIEHIFAGFRADPFSGNIPIQSLTGLGGLGKTQTAVAYAYRYRKHYQMVLWIRADTEGDLVTNFTEIALKQLHMSVTKAQQPENLHAAIQEWLRTTTDWLLILDNADTLPLVEPFLPNFAGGHLLLTSRATAMDTLAQPHALTPLSPDDGALCILRRASYIPWSGQLRDAPSPASVKAAQELSQLMGGLPLALEQAGAYIETTGRGVGGYLELYKQYRPEIQQHSYGDVRSYREAVAFAWTIAREAVELESPAALELLHLCAYLAPDGIPYALFPKDARILGLVLGPVAAVPLRLDQAIT